MLFLCGRALFVLFNPFLFDFSYLSRKNDARETSCVCRNFIIKYIAQHMYKQVFQIHSISTSTQKRDFSEQHSAYN